MSSFFKSKKSRDASEDAAQVKLNGKTSSLWKNLREKFGYGSQASPADRLGGINTPAGRIREGATKGDLDQATLTWIDAIDNPINDNSYTFSYINSSNVHSFAYLPHTYSDGSEKDFGTLLIRFRAGPNSNTVKSTYEYSDFPESLYFEFLTAGSKGRFVWDRIRPIYDGTSRYRKL